MGKTLRLLILFILLPLQAFAWEPTKPITVVLGFAPGSGNEISFRGVSSIIQKKNPKIDFVIEHRPGADSNLGTNHFATLPADGHYISVPSQQGTFVTAEIWHKDTIKFDPFEFEFVTTIAESPLCLVAKIGSPVNTVPQLISTLKNPNRDINFAVGGGAHKVAYEYLTENVNASSKVQAVLYKGPLQAVLGVASGDAEFGIMPIAVAQPLIQSGKVALIGIAGEKKVKAFADAPLLKDYVPGLVVNAGWVIVLPKGTSKEIVQWYVDNFVPAIKSKEAQEFFDRNLMNVNESQLGPEGSKKGMLKLREKWQPIVRKMKPD